MKHNENKKKSSLMEILSLSLSILAIIISILSFILPLIKSKLVIEDPSNIYFFSRTNENYDEIIFPLIFNNYGPFVRSIYKIESTITYEDNLIPIKPYSEYKTMSRTANELNPTLFSTFIIQPNSGVKKDIGFRFDKTNFSNTDRIPNNFHFQPNKTYVINMRFYTTQNSFLGKRTEIIQVIYAFDTKETVMHNGEINISKQTFFKLNDSHVFNH